MDEKVKKSLENIVKNHELVLIDGCISTPFIGDCLTWEFYDKKDLFALNLEQKEGVRDNIEHLDFFSNFVESNPNVMTIKEVTTELKQNLKIFGGQYRFHSIRTKKRLKKGYKCGSDKEMITELMDSLYYFINTLSDRVIRPGARTKEVYSALFDNINLFDEKLRLRKESLMKKKREKERYKEDMYTDIKLVAASFYESLMRNSDVAVISNDSDIRKLMISSYILLTARDLKIPEESIFRNIPRHKPKLYSMLANHSRGYNLYLDLKEAKIRDKFKKYLLGEKTQIENRLLEADKIAQENGMRREDYMTKAGRTWNAFANFYKGIKEKIKRAITTY